MVRPMALDLDAQDGQTPLDPDERAGLIPEHLNTQGDLNDWEQENILRAPRPDDGRCSPAKFGPTVVLLGWQ